jgi:hypothetical protein
VAVKELEQLATIAAQKNHPTLPDYALAPRKFRDDTSNGLTKCITEYIRLSGGFASRVNNTGIYNPKLRKYIYSTSRRGLADIIATYKGFPLHIEVKIGKDRQSYYQRQVETEVTNSGGLYYLARNFTEFKEWFDKIKA